MGSLQLRCHLQWSHPAVAVEEGEGEEAEMVGVAVEVVGVVAAEEVVDQEGGVAMEEEEEGDEVADVVVGVVATPMVVTLMAVTSLAEKDMEGEGAYPYQT